MSFVPLIIAVAYFVILSVIFGVIASRKVKTGTDYFTAQNRLLWPMVMCTFVLTPLGSGHTSSLWEQAGAMGTGVLWWGMLVGGVFVPIFMLWFGPWIRKLKVNTFPQALQKLYGPAVGLYDAAIAPAAWLGIAIAELLSTATAIYTLTGGAIAFTPTCVIIAGIITILYMLFAGNLQASYMNIINAIMLIVGSYIAVIYMGSYLQSSGMGGYEGIKTLLEGMGEGWKTNVMHVDASILWGVMFPVVILHVFAASSEHAMYFPVLAAKNSKEVRKGALPAALINCAAAFPWVILGVVAYAMLGANNAKLSVPDLLIQTFPPVLIGIVMVALLCANLSTGAGLLLSMAHVWTDDILTPIIGKEKIDEKRHKRIGMILVIIVTILGVIPALRSSVAMPIFFFCFSIGLPIFVAYFVGMIYRINRKVCYVALIASLVVNIWWTFWTPSWCGVFNLSFYPVLVVSFVIMFVGCAIFGGDKGMLRQIKEENAAKKAAQSE